MESSKAQINFYLISNYRVCIYYEYKRIKEHEYLRSCTIAEESTVGVQLLDWIPHCCGGPDGGPIRITPL